MSKELKAAIQAGALIALCVLSPMVWGQSSQDDRSASQTSMSASDKATADHVYSALKADKYDYYRHITVTAANGVVTLGGFVSSAEAQSKAKQIAAGVSGVSKVVDHTQLQQKGRSDNGG